ncbi:peptidyl-tRNA hydrolase [Gorgonomyces haynaldii]|nr:peptidyl-tRNA hydrolase [Gorgonomyces haynaldii]
MKLICALWNHTHPNTRHNMGQLVIDRMVSVLPGVEWQLDKKLGGWICQYHLNPLEKRVLWFYKPKEFMNLNGYSIKKCADKLNITPNEILIVQDDTEKPLGKMRIKTGSAQGHNGVKSVHDAFRTTDIKRLLIGIGKEEPLAHFVLSEFTKQEIQVLEETVYPQAVDMIQHFVQTQQMELPNPKKYP